MKSDTNCCLKSIKRTLQRRVQKSGNTVNFQFQRVILWHFWNKFGFLQLSLEWQIQRLNIPEILTDNHWTMNICWTCELWTKKSSTKLLYFFQNGFKKACRSFGAQKEYWDQYNGNETSDVGHENWITRGNLWTMSKITSKSLENENRVKFPEKIWKKFQTAIIFYFPYFSREIEVF